MGHPWDGAERLSCAHRGQCPCFAGDALKSLGGRAPNFPLTSTGVRKTYVCTWSSYESPIYFQIWKRTRGFLFPWERGFLGSALCPGVARFSLRVQARAACTRDPRTPAGHFCGPGHLDDTAVHPRSPGSFMRAGPGPGGPQALAKHKAGLRMKEHTGVRRPPR